MNIKFFKSDKFKSNSISLNIPIELNDKITDINLICEMIKLGSKKYDSLKKLYSKLQEMYGAYFNCYINKCGEVAIFTIYLEFLKDEYINSNESLWSEIIEFLYEVFYNILESDNCFNEKLLEIEKQNLRRNILSLVDSKNYYAYVKCEQLSTKNEPYSNYIYGNVNRINEIDGKILYDSYLKLKESPYYFVVMGSFNEELIKTSLHNKFGKNILGKFSCNQNKFLKTEFVEEFERFDVTQTKLVINFKTPITIFNGDYYAFFVFNKILGSGYSKLYREIRQKRNLVYYINSYYEKFKGMLSIECGIDDSNFEMTKEIILMELYNISKGQISHSEIENSKKSIKKLMFSIQDRVVSTHSFVTPLYIFNKEYEVDKFLNNVNEVTKDRIVEACNQIFKSAIFSVRPLKED